MFQNGLVPRISENFTLCHSLALGPTTVTMTNFQETPVDLHGTEIQQIFSINSTDSPHFLVFPDEGSPKLPKHWKLIFASHSL